MCSVILTVQGQISQMVNNLYITLIEIHLTFVIVNSSFEDEVKDTLHACMIHSRGLGSTYTVASVLLLYCLVMG